MLLPSDFNPRKAISDCICKTVHFNSPLISNLSYKVISNVLTKFNIYSWLIILSSIIENFQNINISEEKLLDLQRSDPTFPSLI